MLTLEALSNPQEHRHFLRSALCPGGCVLTISISAYKRHKNACLTFEILRFNYSMYKEADLPA